MIRLFPRGVNFADQWSLIRASVVGGKLMEIDIFIYAIIMHRKYKPIGGNHSIEAELIPYLYYT